MNKMMRFFKIEKRKKIRWHPFFLNPSAPKEGVNKRDFYRQKFGARSEQIIARMTDVFRGLGLEYNIDGLTGNTLDSHRLIYYAGQQGLDKQHDLVEELFLGYFTRAKYIGDREFLLESAKKVEIEGAAEFLEDPNNGVKEISGCPDAPEKVFIVSTCPHVVEHASKVMEELEKYSAGISGVPYFVINNDQKLSGGQPPEVNLKFMAESASNTTKELIRIDISSDNLCPWCYVGKINLDKAIAASKDQFDIEIHWHPYFLEPSAPKEGVNKRDFYKRKFGSRYEQIIDHTVQEFLVECAEKVGVEGAAEFLEDPNNGLKEVNEDFEKYSAHLGGVPYYVINGKHKFSGGLPPEGFLCAFQVATK
uniref:DSBA-like thioredoxin domain-containing protein n=1 Tax=Chenopodium quinoa TaxID=63459 RepID=A0A803LC92_CHEQI